MGNDVPFEIQRPHTRSFTMNRKWEIRRHALLVVAQIERVHLLLPGVIGNKCHYFKDDKDKREFEHPKTSGDKRGEYPDNY